MPPGDPCALSPCGVNAYCTVSDKRGAVCKCPDNFIGDPRKGCYPECVLNTDCTPDRVCVNYRCRDPCREHHICGMGAVCLCRDHTPTCICKDNFMGNPFSQCVPRRKFNFFSSLKSYITSYILITRTQLKAVIVVVVVKSLYLLNVVLFILNGASVQEGDLL